MRIVKPDPATKTYQGPYESGEMLDGYMAESDAIAAGYRQLVEPPRVTDSVLPWKLRAELGRRKLVQPISDFIATQPEPQRTILGAAWEYVADPIPRRSSFVAAIAAGLRLSDATVDEIFTNAGNIQDA